LEAVVTWVAKNLANKGHMVTLLSARTPFPLYSGEEVLPSNLNIIETIRPSWEGQSAEEAHYLLYKDILENEFGDGDGVVWDNTWHCFSYLSAREFPKMKIIHTNHGNVERQKVSIHELQFPRFIGLSRQHAQYMSSTLKIPVRYVHNGIPLPPIGDTENNDYNKDGNYLLSINRIIKEKGIEESIDLALRTRNAIKIVGDDIHVPDFSYVQMIREKCQASNGLAEYLGLVDNKTKIKLIKECKAVIACPKSTWIEAFGLFAVEANAYGKPVLALANGGLSDIIVNQTNGFLAKTRHELREYVEKIHECSPESCRRRVEEHFTDEIMSKNYLRIFERVIEDDSAFRW
jgi:glycosyltransferase involved in cell wall biosynthesis